MKPQDSQIQRCNVVVLMAFNISGRGEVPLLACPGALGRRRAGKGWRRLRWRPSPQRASR